MPAYPYVAQWASPDLVTAILAGERSCREDPRWRESGADDLDEYEFWSWRACGMAAFKSWLAARVPLDEQPGTVAMAREVEDAGGYRRRSDGSGVDGLIYGPFVDYARRRWGVDAVVAAPLSVAGLRQHVASGGAVIASVDPDLRWPGRGSNRTGGHLVLVFDLMPTGVVLHNPSGDRPESQQAVPVTTKTFAQFFAGRGILLPTADD